MDCLRVRLCVIVCVCVCLCVCLCVFVYSWLLTTKVFCARYQVLFVSVSIGRVFIASLPMYATATYIAELWDQAYGL